MSFRHRFSSRVRRTLESLVPIVCPPEAARTGLAPAIAEEAEATMAAFPSHARAGLLAGLATYELGAAASPLHPGRPASTLGRDAASAYFAAWWSSRIPLARELAKGVKGLLCMSCFEMAEMKQHLSYDPERWIAKVKAERAERWESAIAAHERALRRPDPIGGERAAVGGRAAGDRAAADRAPGSAAGGGAAKETP